MFYYDNGLAMFSAPLLTGALVPPLYTTYEVSIPLHKIFLQHQLYHH